MQNTWNVAGLPLYHHNQFVSRLVITTAVVVIGLTITAKVKIVAVTRMSASRREQSDVSELNWPNNASLLIIGWHVRERSHVNHRRPSPSTSVTDGLTDRQTDHATTTSVTIASIGIYYLYRPLPSKAAFYVWWRLPATKNMFYITTVINTIFKKNSNSSTKKLITATHLLSVSLTTIHCTI